MTQDRKRESRLGSMTTKQKATIGALVFIVLIIIWQVMGLFSESEGSVSTPATTQESPAMQMTATPPGPQSQQPAMGNVSTPSVPPQIPQAAPSVNRPQDAGQLRQAAVLLENKMLETQKNAEEKYLDQLNQLQLLKIQRDIAEMNQAIAAARLATVTAEKSVSDLLTKPAALPPPQVPAGTYSTALVQPTPEGAALTENATPEGPPTQQPPPPPTPTEPPYVVISVSMQLGRWNAVIGVQGKLYSVGVGDVLPADESIVSSINKNGVVLTTKEGKRRKVSIISSI